MHSQESVSKTLLIPEKNPILSTNSPIQYNGRFESLNPEILKQVAAITLSKGAAHLLVTDVSHQYFLVDTSILTSDFEKIYFYKNIIKNNLSIQIEHGLPAKTAWIISENSSIATSVEIASLLQDVKSTSSKMGAKEKKDWLLNN
jgi:hypothetical protein